jgi:hypothetical protein
MKRTIFSLTYAGLLVAAILACGAVASFAQDPCTDVAGQNAMQDEYDKLWAGRSDTDIDKAIDNRKKAIDSGKAFLDKYGSCDSTKERSEWLKVQLPKQEEAVKKLIDDRERTKLVNPFLSALQATSSADATAKAKAYSDASSLGQQILAKWPDDYRPIEIALATIGGDEALIRNNYKFADETLRYAKMAAADLESNKSFVVRGQGADLWGLSMADKDKKVIYNYSFQSRSAADGWMNLYIGYILYNNKNDKVGALPYLYKSSKLVPDSPVSYALIGDYYFDQLKPQITEINTLIASQKDIADADKLKALVQEIKEKVAISNGVAERAMDAYARAYTISTKPEYKTNMKNVIAQVFKVRFPTPPMSVDQWIASAVAKPFVDPTTPVQPIADPEPAKTSGAAETTTTPATTTPAKTQTPAKTGTTVAKKPGVAATKVVAKKRAA